MACATASPRSSALICTNGLWLLRRVAAHARSFEQAHEQNMRYRLAVSSMNR